MLTCHLKPLDLLAIHNVLIYDISITYISKSKSHDY